MFNTFISNLRQSLLDAETDDVGNDPNPHAPRETENRRMEVQRLRREFSLAFIMYMRFGRRAEGSRSMRTIFAQARKEGSVVITKKGSAPAQTIGRVGWEVYEAAGKSQV